MYRNSGEESVKPENWGGAVLMFWGCSGGDSTNRNGECSGGDYWGEILEETAKPNAELGG